MSYRKTHLNLNLPGTQGGWVWIALLRPYTGDSVPFSGGASVALPDDPSKLL